MKTHTLLCGVLLTTLQPVIGIEATLKYDISLPNEEKPKDYFPSASRLKIGPRNTTYLVYDINSVLPTGTLPEDVSKAVLKVWINSTRDFSPGVCEVRRISTVWHEHYSVGNRFGTRPTVGAILKRIPVERSNAYLTIDLTDLVKEWLAGAPNLGIAIMGSSGTQGDFPQLPLTILTAWTDSKENAATSHEPTLQLLVKSR